MHDGAARHRPPRHAAPGPQSDGPVHAGSADAVQRPPMHVAPTPHAASLAQGGRSILPGINLVRLGETDAWSVDEYRAEMRAIASTERARGAIAYTARPFVENRAAIRDVFRDEIWTAPALTPPLASADLDARPDSPQLIRDGELVRIAHPHRDALRAFVTYRVLPKQREQFCERPMFCDEHHSPSYPLDADPAFDRSLETLEGCFDKPKRFVEGLDGSVGRITDPTCFQCESSPPPVVD